MTLTLVRTAQRKLYAQAQQEHRQIANRFKAIAARASPLLVAR